jgi:hypothetical protein
MKKFLIIISVVTVLIIAAGIKFLSKPQKPIPPLSGYELFVGQGCPHCKLVEDFLSRWKDKEKIQINQMEVWYNQDNARIMQARAKACGISPSGMGVPFMVTPDGKCLDGDEPIIDYLKSLDSKK